MLRQTVRPRRREIRKEPHCVHAFKRLEDAAELLRADLREGDLVLLKGRVTQHLSRIFHAQFGTVQCWTRQCRLTLLCDYCPALGFKPFRENGNPKKFISA